MWRGVQCPLRSGAALAMCPLRISTAGGLLPESSIDFYMENYYEQEQPTAPTTQGTADHHQA